MKTRSGRVASQHPRELEAFIELLNLYNVRSYLEIGTRDGDTFYQIMRSLPKGSVGVAVDYPEGPWGRNSLADLKSCVSELTRLGYHVKLVIGKSSEVVEEVRNKYDAIFIDADHRYEEVKRDWQNYGEMSDIVAFHDIIGEGVDQEKYIMGVPKFWNELKQNHLHHEFIDPDDDRLMGIGVIVKGEKL